MPVTQSRPSLAPSEDVGLKPSKAIKPCLKLHVPGFTSLHKDERTKNSEHDQKKEMLHTIRVPRAGQRSSYTHTDAYSAFFCGSRAHLGTERIPAFNNTYLRPNARFFGDQQSGCQRYEIKVEIKTVDLVSSVVTGFFQISGLTDEHPLITTCFKGEIINNPLHRLEWGGGAHVQPKRYSFVTEETNWSSFPKNDLEHWKKLTGCPSHYSESELRKKLQLIQSGQQDSQYIYMRWKEEFLLPDSRVKSLTGASFEGFYYVVLNIGGRSEPNEERRLADIPPGTMSGLYFYTQSEKFQSLTLRYADDRGQVGTFDFA